MMAVHVLDRELGIEGESQEPAPGEHCAAIGRAVRQLVADVRADGGKGNAGGQHGAEPVQGPGGLTAREHVDARAGLHPGAEAEEITRTRHPRHHDAQQAEHRQREIEQCVEYGRVVVGGLRMVVAQELVARDHDAVDDAESEPHPRTAECDAKRRRQREHVDPHEARVLEHVGNPLAGATGAGCLEHLF